MAELKPVEYIMRLDYGAKKGPEVVIRAEPIQELVRCRDCKYYVAGSTRMECSFMRFYVAYPGDYCSRGERRTEGANGEN